MKRYRDKIAWIVVAAVVLTSFGWGTGAKLEAATEESAGKGAEASAEPLRYTLDGENKDEQGILYTLDTAGMTAMVGTNTNASNNSEYAGAGDGHVTIPDVVVKDEKKYTVDTIGKFAFLNCESMVSLTIGDSVTTIETGAVNSSSLESIRLGAGVASIAMRTDKLTSLKEILVDEGNECFATVDGILYDKAKTKLIRFPARKEIDSFVIPDTVTIVGEYAFSNCKGIKEVIFPKSVRIIENFAFSNCSIMGADLQYVFQIMDSAFSNVPGLKWCRFGRGVDIGNGNFNNAGQLAALLIPEDACVGSMAFNNVSSTLKVKIVDDSAHVGGKLTYSNTDAEEEHTWTCKEIYSDSYVRIEGECCETCGNTRNCYMLLAGETEKDLPQEEAVVYVLDENNQDSQGVSYTLNSTSYAATASAGNVTAGDSGNMIIPDMVEKEGVRYKVTSLAQAAFAGNTGMKGISLPARLDGISGKAFEGCTSLAAIDVSEGNPYYLSDRGVLYKRDRSRLLLYPPKKQDKAYQILDMTREIDAYAFQYAALTSVSMPDSLRQIGVHSFSFSKIIAVNLCNVRKLDNNAFSYCDNLEDVRLGNDMVIGAAFQHCNRLKAVLIPEGTKLTGYSFTGCASLQCVVMEKGCTLGADSFTNCAALSYLMLPEDLQELPVDSLSGCTALEKLYIPASVTAIHETGGVPEGEAVTLYVTKGSYAEQYAADNQKNCVMLENHEHNLQKHIFYENEEIQLTGQHCEECGYGTGFAVALQSEIAEPTASPTMTPEPAPTVSPAITPTPTPKASPAVTLKPTSPAVVTRPPVPTGAVVKRTTSPKVTKKPKSVSPKTSKRKKKLKKPVISVKKKEKQGIRYLSIKVKKYEGKYAQIYLKKKKKGKFKRLTLRYKRIKRYKGVFKVQYRKKHRTLYIKVRTYKGKKKKKVYSKFSKTIRIRV